jgi:hypothetical protein
MPTTLELAKEAFHKVVSAYAGDETARKLFCAALADAIEGLLRSERVDLTASELDDVDERDEILQSWGLTASEILELIRSVKGIGRVGESDFLAWVRHRLPFEQPCPVAT